MPIDLSQFDDQYTAAKPPEHAMGDEVPDGKYQAVIDKLELVETKNGKPMLKWQLKIAAGDHEGRCVFKNSVIQANTLDFLKKDLSLLGFNGKLTELEQPEGRMALIGKMVEIAVVTKGMDDQGRANRNVYINKAVNAVSNAPDANKPPF